MTTTVTTVRFLELASRYADLARRLETARQQAIQLEAEKESAFEKLTDQEILLQGAYAELATCEMERLQVQQNIRQKTPKLKRLRAALDRETIRFSAACHEGGEAVVQAGRDYALAFEEHKAHSAAIDELGQRCMAIENQWLSLHTKVTALEASVGKAREAYGEIALTFEGLREVTPTSGELLLAEKAARQAAVDLFGSK